MFKIDKLTPEQEAQIPIFVERYTKIGLSTEPIDPDKAREAINHIYDLLEEPHPEEIKIFPGPRAAWNYVCEEYGRRNNCSEEEVGDFKKNFILPKCQGNLSAGYCAFADYLEYLGLEPLDIYKKWRNVLDIHLTWLLPGFAVLCDRPQVINMQGTNLHCDDGPALAYGDGTKAWVFEGIMVDETIIMRPTQQTIAEIESDQNLDRRTIRINRYGWVQYLEGIKAECLDERANEAEDTYEALYKTENWGHRLVATCITGDIITVGVPPTITTCQEAQDWLRSNKKFNVLGRT